MGLLEDVAQWLDTQRDVFLSVPVTYQKKGCGPRTLTATLGRTVFRAENEYGAVVRTESRDFLISASHLPDEPQRGDCITCAGRVFEVLAPNAEPVWRWSGTGQVTRRIHTKEVRNA